MLREARVRARGVDLVRGDLAHLPFARASLDAAWARNSYMHLPERELPGALAELHRVLRPGGRVRMSLGNMEVFAPTARERERGLASRRGGELRLRGRLFVGRDARGWRELFEGAGFRAIRVEPGHEPFWLWVSARRARSLADSLAPGLRMLVCGLNPSPDAAASGVPFAGATNRFWSAAVRAGLVARERDLRDALARGVGFTDLVKRTTPDSRALSRAEYVRGAQRVARLVQLWQPRALVFVGLEGVRRALDPRAQPGALRGGFAGRPAYLMPSTSGRNAAATLDTLVAHLRRAQRLTGAARIRLNRTLCGSARQAGAALGLQIQWELRHRGFGGFDSRALPPGLTDFARLRLAARAADGACRSARGRPRAPRVVLPRTRRLG